MKPGLSSSGAFRLPSAAVQPGRVAIVTDEKQIVKSLANSFENVYTINKNLKLGVTDYDVCI